MTSLDITPAAIAAALVLALLASAAAHGEAPGGVGRDRVRFELRGHIAPRCSLSGMPSAIELGRIGLNAGETQRKLAFRLDCNAPFTYTISSDAGGMRNDAGGGRADAQQLIPYGASMTIATDSGRTLRLACQSRDIAEGGGCQGHSGDDTAIGKDAELSISWTLPKTPLAQGRYSAPLRLEFGLAN